MKMKRKIRKIFLLFTLAMQTQISLARSALMPWEYFGMDSYTKNVFENYLLSVDFQKKFLPNSISLNEYVNKNSIFITTTQSYKAKKIFVQDDSSKLDTYIQPISCKLTKTKYLFATIYSSAQSQRIRHINVELFDLKDKNRIKNIELVVNKLKRKPIGLPNSNVKISLSLKRGSQYESKGSYNCLNILVAKNLIKKYHTKNPLGYFNYKFLKNFIPIEQSNLRSNRNLSIEWHISDTEYKAKASLSETTLAAPVINPLPFTGELSEILDVTINQKIIDRLDIMEKTLSPSEPPMVIKVYGAWAYLDKGRAWGLEMGDRLWFDVNGRRVKGHVVQYFGPGLRLRSPRDRKVTEGAILFIRTGQHSVHIGDTFEFDPTVFPTPWPPVQTPILTKK